MSIFLFSENFKDNSFEQLSINFMNEKVCEFANNRLIEEEVQFYKMEGLEIPQINFLSNENVIGTKKHVVNS